MEGEIAQGALGSAGKYDIEFKEGALVIEVTASVEMGSASLVIKVPAAKVLDAIAAAIPGKMDDAVIALVKSGLGV